MSQGCNCMDLKMGSNFIYVSTTDEIWDHSADYSGVYLALVNTFLFNKTIKELQKYILWWFVIVRSSTNTFPSWQIFSGCENSVKTYMLLVSLSALCLEYGPVPSQILGSFEFLSLSAFFYCHICIIWIFYMYRIWFYLHATLGCANFGSYGGKGSSLCSWFIYITKNGYPYTYTNVFRRTQM